ncbi:MAG: S8 family peptidase [Pyrinomonadaceae bacterium]
MIKKIPTLIATFFLCLILGAGVQAATLSPELATQLNNAADDLNVGTVIIAFNTSDGLNDSHLNVLRAVGIKGGYTFQNLGMVAATLTAGQVRALAARGDVRAVWHNEQMEYHMHQARVLAGVDRVRTHADFTRRNGGIPISGQGDFSVLVIDSGVDATHTDLKLGPKVVQNVQVMTSSDLLAPEVEFTPLVVVENVPNTDQTVGHGTHCAGIIGGTGQASGSRYAGVAPGAKLIGSGLGAGLFVLNALGAWEWALANQFQYNIRVVSNSYGSVGSFNPDNPINVASKMATDRNMVVVFSASNSGPGKDSHNRYGKAPWVISVAAGTKEGGLANFSSRGIPREERLSDSDPLNDFDAPTITAPGTGREFPTNATKFTSDIVSTRSTSNLVANGGEADAELPPAYLPFYTQISGTSMSTPFIAGVVALMLDADPTLSVEEVRSILTETVTRMPGREDYEVGAGYVNVVAALDKVFNRERNYGTFREPQFNAALEVVDQNQSFSINYNPATTATNSMPFTVEAGTDILDVFARIPAPPPVGGTNIMSIRLTDPNGVNYNSSTALPVLNAPTRQVVVNNPVAGTWTLTARGYNGAALPTTVTGTIKRRKISPAPIGDIQGHAAQAAIEAALERRRMDAFVDGTFRPDAEVTREDFARTLALNTPLRQTLSGATQKFTDVSADFAPLAEAITAKGSTLRDFNFTPDGLLSATGTTFNSNGATSRLDLAVAFVRGLGLDEEARAKANTIVMSGGAALTDNSQIPGALRGYVQLAIDKGFLEVYPAEVRQIGPGQFIALPGPRVEPTVNITRAALAAKINSFVQRFNAGS